MTMGDRGLEAEVLGLFLRHASASARLADMPPAEAARLIHTVKGSAQAIGASQVAACAERIEAKIAGGGMLGATEIAQLSNAVDAVCAAIAARLASA